MFVPFAPLLQMLANPHGLPVAAGLSMPLVLPFLSAAFVFLTSLNDRAYARCQRSVLTMLL